MDPMELVLSNSETVPRKAIFKFNLNDINFKTEQTTSKLNFNTFIIFTIININFITFKSFKQASKFQIQRFTQLHLFNSIIKLSNKL